MSRNDRIERRSERRVELKYCERCGGLWVRDTGVDAVYCAKCEVEVAELPIARKKQGRVSLPVQVTTFVEEYVIDDEDDLKAFGAAGGVA